MKKTLCVLSALLFIGAGCASIGTTSTTQPAEVPTTAKTAPAATTPKPAVGTDVKTSVQILPAEETVK